MILSYSEAIDNVLASIRSFKYINKPLVIAIDGRSASGKTTFATFIREKSNACIVHTDDFFRPRNASGQIEMSEFDGNFDLKRFKAEVVDNILVNKGFEYGVYDCTEGNIVKIKRCDCQGVIIVEGAYSLNPNLGKYADIKLFFDIGVEEQKSRIIARNGINGYKAFNSVWLPAEERYFSHYNIKDNCDFTVKTTIIR